MIQNVSLLVTCILSFSIGIRCNDNALKRRYLLFAKVDSSARIKENAKIILNGKEIGMLKKINPVDGKKVLDLKIDEDIKIPSGSRVMYFENILGDAYVSFTFPETSAGKFNLLPNDTIKIDSVMGLHKLDTAAGKKILKEINDVIQSVDSSLKQQ